MLRQNSQPIADKGRMVVSHPSQIAVEDTGAQRQKLLSSKTKICLKQMDAQIKTLVLSLINPSSMMAPLKLYVLD